MVNALWVFTLATIPQTFQSMCVFGWSNKAIIIIIIMEKRTKIFIFIKKEAKAWLLRAAEYVTVNKRTQERKKIILHIYE